MEVLTTVMDLHVPPAKPGLDVPDLVTGAAWSLGQLAEDGAEVGLDGDGQP
jgi:hypothetical protein